MNKNALFIKLFLCERKDIKLLENNIKTYKTLLLTIKIDNLDVLKLRCSVY